METQKELSVDPPPHAYGDLAQFKELVLDIDACDEKIRAILKFITPLLDTDVYDQLTLEEKVQHDIFVAYMFSSLFWMQHKTLGLNPAASRIKGEIDRVKEHAKRLKSIKDRKTMPRIDAEAAKRFVRSGLWTPNANTKPGGKRKRED